MLYALVNISYIIVFVGFAYFAAAYGVHWADSYGKRPIPVLPPLPRLVSRLTKPCALGLIPTIAWISIDRDTMLIPMLVIGAFATPCVATAALLLPYYMHQDEYGEWYWWEYTWKKLAWANDKSFLICIVISMPLLAASPLDEYSYILVAALAYGWLYCLRQERRYMDIMITASILKTEMHIPRPNIR